MLIVTPKDQTLVRNINFYTYITMNELQMQAQCFNWHHQTYQEERGLLRRIKNELDNHPRKTARDTKIQLAENKATGIVGGTWDMLYLLPPTIWMEAKMGENVLSETQKEFRRIVMDLGHLCFVFYSFEEFKKIIYALHES